MLSSIKYAAVPTTMMTPTTMRPTVTTNGMLHPATSERVPYERQHATEIHDTDRQDERRGSEELVRQRRLIARRERPRPIEHRQDQEVQPRELQQNHLPVEC